MPLFALQDIAEQVRALVNPIDATEAETCVDVEWRALFQEHTWSFARKSLALTTVVAKTAGTITATANSTLVTGTGTAFATPEDVGKVIRLPDTNIYEVAAVAVGTQTLTLVDPYTGATVTDTSYTLFQHRYTLPAGIERIVTMGSTLGPIREAAGYDLDRMDARRMVSGPPYRYVPLTDTPAGLKQIELWPVPLVAYHFPYVGLLQGEGEEVETIVANLSTLLLELSCKRACMLAYGMTEKPHWLKLMAVYDGQAEKRLALVKKMDRKRFGYPEAPAESFVDSWASDPGLDLGPLFRW